MVDFELLASHLLDAGAEPFGLVSHQAIPTADRLRDRFGGQLAVLMSPEHGFFGSAAAGEKTVDARHPDWDIPVYSLYGETRKPTPAMMAGLGRIVFDLQDLGVRCYTYLGTLKLVLEAAAESGLPVTVVDRPLPLGGMIDGPMRPDPAFASFVAPLNVPLCHGMTPGEAARWIVRAEGLELDLTVVPMTQWSHRCRGPWSDFVPPSPAIRSWDTAVMYPATVFSEAYPSLDCDRAGALAFRVLGAPWMKGSELAEELRGPLSVCGIGVRPYRYSPATGPYAGRRLEGMLLSCEKPDAFYPVTGGVLMLAAIRSRHAEELERDARPEWFDRLFGGAQTRAAIEAGAFSPLFESWIAGQNEYLKMRISLY